MVSFKLQNNLVYMSTCYGHNLICCLMYQGTGKSVTGAHLAYAFYCKNKSVVRVTDDKRIKCVLVCGPSNKSVDVVLGKL